MGERLKFDYYYGNESEQFTFYRVPRMLIKDKRFSKLSSDAKLLYGLMLDRMSLSMRNGWMDEENRAYIIYKIEEAEEDLGVSKPTAVKIMAELDAKTGIGLIEKKKIGLGKPDIIYVKNFIGVEISAPECEKEFGNPDNSTEVKNFNFKKSNNLTSESKEFLLQEVKIFASNYTEYSQIEENYTDSIHPSFPPGEDSAFTEINQEEHYTLCEHLVRQNIDYDALCQNNPHQTNIIDEIVRIMTDVISVDRKKIRVNNTLYPYKTVRDVFLKLGGEHIEYVLESLRQNPVKISNIRNYLITLLYNSYSTLHNNLSALVNYDMNGGGWIEKGVVT